MLFFSLVSLALLVFICLEIKNRWFFADSNMASSLNSSQGQKQSWDPRREHSGQKSGAAQGAWVRSTVDRNGRTIQEAVLIKEGNELVTQEIYAVSFDGIKKKIFDRELSRTGLKGQGDHDSIHTGGLARIPETKAGTPDDEKLCRSIESGLELRCTECFQMYSVYGCSYR